MATNSENSFNIKSDDTHHRYNASDFFTGDAKH
jgi:hypothetical protein